MATRPLAHINADQLAWQFDAAGPGEVDVIGITPGNPGGYKLTTKSGYGLDEVASALQKCIRRGLEEDAMYWALEIEETFHNYVWKRLTIIACEDIGMCNPHAAILMNSLWQIYETIRKNTGRHVDEDVLAFGVLYLCRSPKNREVDEFMNTVLVDWKKGPKKDIPDFALDMHTEKGRRNGATIADFWTTGSEVSPEVGGSRYRRRARLSTTGQDFGVEDDPDTAFFPQPEGRYAIDVEG